MNVNQMDPLVQLELLSTQSKTDLIESRLDTSEPQQLNSTSPHCLSKSEESSADPTELELSRVQKFIQEKLAEKKYSVDTMLEELIEIAQTWKIPNPVTWEMEYSHKIQLEAKKLLLEMTGLYKWKQSIWNTFNLTKIIYQAWLR